MNRMYKHYSLLRKFQFSWITEQKTLLILPSLAPLPPLDREFPVISIPPDSVASDDISFLLSRISIHELFSGTRLILRLFDILQETVHVPTTPSVTPSVDPPLLIIWKVLEEGYFLLNHLRFKRYTYRTTDFSRSKQTLVLTRTSPGGPVTRLRRLFTRPCTVNKK